MQTNTKTQTDRHTQSINHTYSQEHAVLECGCCDATQNNKTIDAMKCFLIIGYRYDKSLCNSQLKIRKYAITKYSNGHLRHIIIASEIIIMRKQRKSKLNRNF